MLSRDELRRVAALLARLGVRRVRPTGGEPTLRREVVEIARDLASTPGIDELAITTNAHRELARPLREAGVGSVNASLDTLRADRLAAGSGRGARRAAVLAGIDRAAEVGFDHLEINTVVMGGVNEDELGDLVRHAWARSATPRFIELMPFGRASPPRGSSRPASAGRRAWTCASRCAPARATTRSRRSCGPRSAPRGRATTWRAWRRGA